MTEDRDRCCIMVKGRRCKRSAINAGAIPLCGQHAEMITYGGKPLLGYLGNEAYEFTAVKRKLPC